MVNNLLGGIAVPLWLRRPLPRVGVLLATSSNGWRSSPRPSFARLRSWLGWNTDAVARCGRKAGPVNRSASVLTVALLACSLASAAVHAQAQPTIYIDTLAGGDDYAAERYRLLFLEALLKVKSVKVVPKKELAQFVLGGIGKVETFGASSSSEFATGRTAVGNSQSGAGWSATLSITLTEQATETIVFVTNQSSTGSASKGSTQTAVDDAVKAMKKAMKWK